MTSISENITSYLNSLYGSDAAKKYLDFIKEEPAQYIRVNQLKIPCDTLAEKLFKKYSIRTMQVDNVPNALKVVSNEGLTGKTLEHILGLYYIQGLSSMLPPIVLSAAREDKILDLCAAPGSKTTQISEMMNNTGTLIANEIQLDRIKTLVFNIDRMNVMNCGVVHAKGELLSKSFPDYFDKILVDAPCSGLGIIQKKGEVSNWWSVKRAERLGELQIKLLVAAVKMLKVGGEIVYSTCTLTPEENEFVIDKILKKYPVQLAEVNLPVNSIDAFTSYKDLRFDQSLVKARRVLPWEVNSDGFFIAKLIKTDNTQSPEPVDKQSYPYRIINHDHKDIRIMLMKVSEYFNLPLKELAKFKYILKLPDILFIDAEWSCDNPGVFHRIGTKFGTVDKLGNLILNTQSAQVFGKDISKNIFALRNKEDLKKYLEGGVVKRDEEIRGQCIVKYDDLILGTGVTTVEGMKSRFPRAKRTQEIYTDW